MDKKARTPRKAKAVIKTPEVPIPATLFEWLDLPIPESDLRQKLKPNGEIAFLFHPIEICEPKLDKLRQFGGLWGTENFKILHYSSTRDFEIDASIELVINWEKHPLGYNRPYVQRLVGTTTFSAQEYWPNKKFSSIAHSLCIVSAARRLGNIFGRQLYTKGEEPAIQLDGAKAVPPVKEKRKPNADMAIRKKLGEAVLQNDFEMISKLQTSYEFNLIQDATETEHNPD